VDEQFSILLTHDGVHAAHLSRERPGWSVDRVAFYLVEVPILPRRSGEAEPVGSELGSLVATDFPQVDEWRVILPATWCLCQEVAGEGSGKDDQALAYDFEEFVPVEAEELTCVPVRTKGQGTLVAAVFTEAMRGFLSGFEGNRRIVESMTVDVSAAAVGGGERDEADWAFVIVDGKRMTLGRTVGGRLQTSRTSLAARGESLLTDVV